MLLFTLVSTVIFRVHPVWADVPSVKNIEVWMSETDTILSITIRHASPTSSHYVDKVEVDVNGTIQTIDLPPLPQSTVTFVHACKLKLNPA